MTEIFTDSSGNTYELAATISPNTAFNPGITGAVSYFFNELTAGISYDFVIVAFNGDGYSGFAGPITAFKILNFEPMVDMWQPPYGWWNQVEQWGSQNGLTYLWPGVWPPQGAKGPSKAQLALGNFPPTMTTTDNNWPGVGDPAGVYDIDWSKSPWNTSTGYINMTFGSTGFILREDVISSMQIFSWIPPSKRILFPGRWWRAIDGIPGYGQAGITNADSVVFSTGARAGKITPTPWLGRKMQFVRKELREMYAMMGACGFTMGGLELDDEYYGFFDLRTVNNETVGRDVWLYPSNSSTGFTWWVSFTGPSAAPDSLRAEGINSMREFLLSVGYTTGSGWKNVDGLTFRGSCTGVTGNVAVSGSHNQWQLSEYTAILRDWVAMFWTDLTNDFASSFGLTADNYPISDYGYYQTHVGVASYKEPPATGWTFTGYMNRNSSDYVPYPTPVSDRDPNVTKYYSFDSHDISRNSPKTFTRNVGNMSDIHVYGGLAALVHEISNAMMSLDRNLDYSGNSYGNANSGMTFGILPVASFTMYNVFNILGENKFLKKWLPQGYLGSTSPSGQLVEFLYCAEKLGNSAAFRFDPSGSSGSTTCSPSLCGYDRAPHFVSWHLNPVFNTEIVNWDAGSSYGPANHIPTLARDIVNGLSMGGISVRRNRNRGGGGFTFWSRDDFDTCGYPVPGMTLPAGSIYNQYWTHWYPMGFMALINDIKWGRQVALVNTYKARAQRNGMLPPVSNSIWNGIQKPINTWLAIQNWESDEAYDAGSIDSNSNLNLANYYYVPTGVTFGQFIRNSLATGQTAFVGEAGPMFYENVRHQYLNKTWKYSYWNPVSYTCTWNSAGPMVRAENQRFPRVVSGVTSYGVCGAVAMNLARKLNDVIHECNIQSNGIVSETMYLAPINMDEREYVFSGAQLIDGRYLWRITFANPVNVDNIQVQGSVTSSITNYNVSGITNFINEPNNKFGIWWYSDVYEIPIVLNPPVSEAQRLGVVNLPTAGITYNPLYMKRGGVTAGGIVPIT